MTEVTPRQRLKQAHANGPVRIETREIDGESREFRVFVLADATRDEMLEAAELSGSPHWDLYSSDTAYDDPEWEGWSVVGPYVPFMDGGVVAHRGVLAPGEYVDYFVLREQVEEALGYSYLEMSEAYAQGRPTAEQRQLREKTDARLLALRRAGGNMDLLGQALNIGPATIDRALARARQQDESLMVQDAPVKMTRYCFLCGDSGALPRKRFHEGCPRSMLPDANVPDSYIDLCGKCFHREDEAA